MNIFYYIFNLNVKSSFVWIYLTFIFIITSKVFILIEFKLLIFLVFFFFFGKSKFLKLILFFMNLFSMIKIINIFSCTKHISKKVHNIFLWSSFKRRKFSIHFQDLRMENFLRVWLFLLSFPFSFYVCLQFFSPKKKWNNNKMIIITLIINCMQNFMLATATEYESFSFFSFCCVENVLFIIFFLYNFMVVIFS